MRNTPRNVFVFSLVLLFGATGAVRGYAATQTPAKPEAQSKEADAAENAMKLLLLIDEDKDGTISKEEWQASMGKEFDRMDGNSSGTLDMKELMGSRLRVGAVNHGQETNAKQLSLLIDGDKDGTISKKEWLDFMEKEFNRMEKDKDATLDAQELIKSRLYVDPAAPTKW